MGKVQNRRAWDGRILTAAARVITNMTEPEALPGRLDARYRAFIETLTQLRPKLHRYCARMTGSTMDGEDVVQEALVDAYRKLESWDESRPIAPWLFRIAHNRCIDFLRRREVRAQAEEAAFEPTTTDAVEPAGPALGRAMEHLVQHLPPKERASVLLKDVFDYSIDEIAELTASTPGGVKSALHRGREKLQALPPPAPRTAALLPPDTERLLRLYVERFNNRDWDGLRALIAADATLRVTDLFDGPMKESPYFTRYSQFGPLVARLGTLDGELVVAIYPESADSVPARAFIRITAQHGAITHITDYTHCPWMVAFAGDVSPVPPHA